MAEMKKDDLKKISGGAPAGDTQPSYQLTYNGVSLPMTNTVAQMCETYPALKTKLGFFYGMFANMTLNEVCASYGQSTVQNLLNNN